jgi:RNA polymerase sigma factor (sigma-70 family)
MPELSVEQPSRAFVDQGTMLLLQSRDRAFLEKLFGEVTPYLTRVCHSNGVASGDTSDLIHQAWEVFFTHLGRFEARSQIRTFVCGILINKIREHRRARNRVIPEEDTEKFMNSAFTPDGWWRTPPGDPYRLTELREAKGLVEECLAGLTDQQRAAFLLKEVEGENSDFVCNVLGVEHSHLRVLIFRAKEKLRKCLEGKVSVEQV